MIKRNIYEETNLVGRKDGTLSLSWFFSSDLSARMHRHAQYDMKT